MLSIAYFRVAASLWAVVILVLTIIPTENVPITFSGSDKIAHTAIFALLSYLLHGSFSIKVRVRYIVTILISSAYGIGTELLQNLVPGRNADVYDLVFNVIGAIAGATIFYLRAKN